MIRFILGEKGTGKTKWLIDNANEDIKSGNGNIAFVEFDDDHIYSLDYNARLINATEFRLNTLDAFYGFLCGLMAMDYDLEKIYVDGLYKIMDLTVDDLKNLHKRLSALDLENRALYINVDMVQSDIPEDLQDYVEEMKVDA
ncbi:MAG: hypothetical protein Q4E76_02030 [Tissierellia bacterium]|nr:hypothetical protein [Tissierellia bacterium]